jgi:hypothetical protein
MHKDGNGKGSSYEPALLTGQVQDISAEGSALETIVQIDSSLEAIRNRIDEAYNHICMDLPEVNMEIFRTFQQASDTLDSLSANGSTGTIASVVEGVEITLQNVMIRIKHLRNHDVRFLETIRLTCQNTPLVQASGDEDGLLQSATQFMAKRDELMVLLSRLQEEEDELIEDISSCISCDIRALEITLNSAVDILKDLISRSNLVKEPILKIMSGLQTHDIVNQDISTISLGLRKMYALRSFGSEEIEEPCSCFFQEKASALSRELVSQLIDVVRHHGLDLNEEISNIENLIFHVKEDKDAISEFLLTNLDGMSTFDIVIAEVGQMFAHIIARVDGLSAGKERQQSLRVELAELFCELDRHASRTLSCPLPQDMSNLVLRMISPLKPQALMLREGNSLQELREKSWTLRKDADLVSHKLEEIKGLLIGSIRGIDTYSCRCIDAITKFKQDIRLLMKTLDGSDRLVDGLESITLSLRDMPGKGTGDPCTPLPDDLREIIYRLENPHSSSLVMQEKQVMDEGLTFF